jgi:hypothetical protein
MEFIDELKTLTRSHNSEKLKELKNRLRKRATDGFSDITLSDEIYDEHVILWLKIQGFVVTEISDQRQGDYLLIKW